MAKKIKEVKCKILKWVRQNTVRCNMYMEGINKNELTIKPKL